MTKKKVEGVLDPDDVKRHTQEQAAGLCGINRTTLLRMEQRDELPKPEWVKLPVPHRVYSDNDVKHIRQVIRAKGEKAGRKFMDEKAEAVHREAAGE